MLPVPTRMRVFEHLGVKLALNTISTGTMVKFGRLVFDDVDDLIFSDDAWCCSER